MTVNTSGKEQATIEELRAEVNELEEELRIANDALEIMQKMRPLPHATKEETNDR